MGHSSYRTLPRSTTGFHSKRSGHRCHRGESVYFELTGFLSDEFERLYASLYDDHEVYIRIVESLARWRSGYARGELLQAANLPSGGTSTKVLTALEESGFIAKHIPLGKRANEGLFRLTDEYSLFYLTWIRRARRASRRNRTEGHWMQRRNSPSWRAWSGYAFEEVCWKHIHGLKQGLGIGGVRTEESVWRCSGEGTAAGCQIDLLIDRDDGCITVCEMKYSQSPFAITKAYAKDLRRKVEVFKSRTGTRKNVFLTMVTTNGIRRNIYSEELVSNQLTLDDLFL